MGICCYRPAVSKFISESKFRLSTINSGMQARTADAGSRPSKEVVVSISQSSDIPPEKLQMLTDLFALADCDGSGAIDANELGKLLSKFGGEMPEAEVQAMMKAVDTDAAVGRSP